MILTQLEELALRDLARDGGVAVMRKGSKDRKDWQTTGLKKLVLDTRAVAGPPSGSRSKSGIAKSPLPGYRKTSSISKGWPPNGIRNICAGYCLYCGR